MINSTIKKEWIEKLRSGEYKQCREELRHNESYCCLGVLFYHVTNGPDVISEITDSAWQKLVDMNDTDQRSFREIADWIELNL